MSCVVLSIKTRTATGSQKQK